MPCFLFPISSLWCLLLVLYHTECWRWWNHWWHEDNALKDAMAEIRRRITAKKFAIHLLVCMMENHGISTVKTLIISSKNHWFLTTETTVVVVWIMAMTDHGYVDQDFVEF